MGENRVQPDRGGEQPSPRPRREVELPEYDWQDIDWLEETPSAPESVPPEREELWEEPVTQQAPRPQQTSRPQQAPRPQQTSRPQQAPRPQQTSRPQQAPRPQQTSRQPRPQQPERAPARAPRRQAYEPERQPVRQQQPRRQAQGEPWRDERYARQAVAVEPDDYRPRRRSGRKQSIPLIIMVVILVGGILFAGGKLGSILLNYHRDRSAYNNLADEILAGLAEPDATSEPGATPEPEEQTRSEVPITITGEKWNELKGINSDIIGWLYCPNTAINYPVMQTTDNDYYLHRSYDRQPNTAGALFADYNAAIGITLSNFIVYGHNMKDGSMFATAYDYTTQEFYNQHPVMYLLTPSQNYRVELIAAHITESTLDNYPGYFQGEGDYQNYLNLITSSSFFRTNATVSSQYQLITMSTCDYSSSYNDPRFLLHGQLIPVQ